MNCYVSRSRDFAVIKERGVNNDRGTIYPFELLIKNDLLSEIIQDWIDTILYVFEIPCKLHQCDDEYEVGNSASKDQSSSPNRQSSRNNDTPKSDETIFHAIIYKLCGHENKFLMYYDMIPG
jgi:hypothetical protein